MIQNHYSLLFYLYKYRYVIIYEKGYQATDKAIVSTITKVKGTTFVDFGKFNSTLFNGVRIYDPEDYVIEQVSTPSHKLLHKANLASL